MSDTATEVYQFGCPSWADLDDQGMAQLRLAHRLGNELVATSRRADELRRAGADPKMLSAARNAVRKELRRWFAAEGLHWGSSNAVLEGDRTAEQLVIQRRKQGRPAQRRFRRWDGSGTLTGYVMVDRSRGLPDRTPDVLQSDDSPWWKMVRFELDPTPRRGGRRHAMLHMRIDTTGHMLAVPFVMHRPLPADGEIACVSVTRRRLAGGHRLSVQFTVKRPATAPREVGRVVAVRSGWRSDAGVVVATVAGASPPPDDLDLFVRRSGAVWEVVYPDELSAIDERVERIRSHRDRDVEAIKRATVDLLKEETVDVEATAGDVSRWRSPGRFARLARDWPEGHPHAEVLEAWRHRDRHLWEFEAHERRQVDDRRRDAWRKVAAWVCRDAQRVVVSDLDIADLRERRDDDENRWAAAGGRRNIQAAAPGELRARIVTTAQRDGVEVVHATHETATKKEEEEA